MKLLPVLVLALTLPLGARFEERIEDCTKRYGAPKPSESRPSAQEFKKNGISIVAHFGKDGRCNWISFTNEVGFSEDEARYLVQVNAWAREPKQSHRIEDAASAWEAGKNGEFLAALSSDRKRVVICNEEGFQWSQKIDAVGARANPPKSLEGF